MGTLHHVTHIEAAPDRVWAVLSDLVAVQRYNPLVAAAQFVPGAREGVGASRQCALKPKGTVKERVTAWEPGRAIAFEVIESDWPMTRMRWRTEIGSEATGTKLSQVMEYEMKFGWLGRLLDALIVRRQLDRAIGSVFAGLKRYVESDAV